MSKLIQRLRSNNKIQHFDPTEPEENEDHALSLKEIHWGFNKERKRFLIDPTATLRQIWNIFIIFLVFYISITLPYELGFKIPETTWYVTVSYTVDGFFTIDLILNCFTTYKDPETHFFVNNYKQVFFNYLKGWFTIDFLSVFPFEIVAITAIGGTWYRMLKCVRLLRISKVLKQIKSNKTSEMSNVIRLGWMVILFCLVIHWMACVFAATTIYFNNDVNWIQVYELTSTSRYVAALYWSTMTVTTVGYGDIVPQNDTERLVNSIIMVFGSLIYAVIFGNISLYIAVLQRNETNYQESVATLIAHMKDILLPSKLQRKVLSYHDYVWQKNRGENDKNKLGDIPQRVQVEVAVKVHGTMIKLNPAFAAAPQSFINAIALTLRFTVCLPNEYVFQEGEIATSIYFIGRGQVGVFRNKFGSMTVLEAKAGSCPFFGEIPLFLEKDEEYPDDETKYIERTEEITGSLLKMFRIHSVRGYAYCDLWKCDFESFNELMNSHPSLKTMIVAVAQDRIKQKRFYADDIMIEKAARKLRSSLNRRNSRRSLQPLLLDDDTEEKHEADNLLGVNSEESLKILYRLEKHILSINDKVNAIDARATNINSEIDKMKSEKGNKMNRLK